MADPSGQNPCLNCGTHSLAWKQLPNLSTEQSRCHCSSSSHLCNALFANVPQLLVVQEALLAGRASLLLAEATWGEKAADVSVDYLQYRWVADKHTIKSMTIFSQCLYESRHVMILSPSYSQFAEGAAVSCEPYDSAAVAVPAKPTRGTYILYPTCYMLLILRDLYTINHLSYSHWFALSALRLSTVWRWQQSFQQEAGRRSHMTHDVRCSLWTSDTRYEQGTKTGTCR